MSTNQKWVLASMSSGFLLENMDVMFLSFSLSEIIAQMHISSAAGGWIGTFTYLGMFFGGALFGLLGDRIGLGKALKRAHEFAGRRLPKGCAWGGVSGHRFV